jgi:RNA polymerase sigma-70 factor (ECF subfamily)
VTDDELVARARLGDAVAFGELVLRHQAAVYRAALAATRSTADADDVGQEAFLLAYRRLNTFRGTASFKTWLLTIAWNRAINRRRANLRWWRRIVDIGSDGPGAEDTVTNTTSFATLPESPEQLAADAEQRQHIRAAIVCLPRKLRDALLLVQSGEYTYEEIGAMLHAPVGTIKWRVSEARRLVKKALGDSDGEYRRT